MKNAIGQALGEHQGAAGLRHVARVLDPRREHRRRRQRLAEVGQRTGLTTGDYKVRGWVKKGGNFDFTHFQIKTCPSCQAVGVALGSIGNWQQVETPSVHVTGGYVELGLHTKAAAGNSANFAHLDNVELITL